MSSYAAVVPRVLTPVPCVGLADLMAEGYRAATGEEPQPGHVRLAVAQLELEHGLTGEGQGRALRAVWCWNLGNQDAGEGWAGAVFSTVPEAEGSGAATWTAVHMRRAYASAADGATGYWRFMLERCPLGVEAMAADDAPGFVVELRAAGYFTGSPGAYLRAVASLERAE